jgi:hypothetical protein
VNDIALGHLQKQGLKAAPFERLQTNPLAGDDWAAYVDRLGISDERHHRIATEAGFVGWPRGPRPPSAGANLSAQLGQWRNPSASLPVSGSCLHYCFIDLHAVECPNRVDQGSCLRSAVFSGSPLSSPSYHAFC